MTPLELRASLSLASIFALRMLGLFLVLPVFALEAQKYPGGDDPLWVGLALGAYGLTQAALQIPLGVASDRWGRKRIIVIGLLVFALGGLLAAAAQTIQMLMLGRALQGGGAVSAAVTALLADQTRDSVRTKGMALIGASIGLTFALSLVLAPSLSAWIGLAGLFGLMTLLAGVGIAIIIFWTPAEPDRQGHGASNTGLSSVLRHPMLWRLNLGVLVLHAVQMAMWVVMPALLVQAGVAKADHWHVYLPAVMASFLVLGAVLFPLERRGYLRQVMQAAIGLLALVQVGLWWSSTAAPSQWLLGILLFLFFCAFNVLEASQPSLVTRLASGASRGAAMGVYNTLQSLGLFVGGALGGLLVKAAGPSTLFLATLALVLLWWALGRGLQLPAAASGLPSA